MCSARIMYSGKSKSCLVAGIRKNNLSLLWLFLIYKDVGMNSSLQHNLQYFRFDLHIHFDTLHCAMQTSCSHKTYLEYLKDGLQSQASHSGQTFSRRINLKLQTSTIRDTLSTPHDIRYNTKTVWKYNSHLYMKREFLAIKHSRKTF